MNCHIATARPAPGSLPPVRASTRSTAPCNVSSALFPALCVEATPRLHRGPSLFNIGPTPARSSGRADTHGGAEVAAASRIASLSTCVVFAVFVGCADGAPVAEVPTFDLSGGPAFPLEAHLESADIAAGNYNRRGVVRGRLRAVPHSFNGLDGVGIARLPDGTPLARFSVPPTGGKGGGMVSSQSCGECHNMPHAAAAGLASTNRAGDPDKDGLPPFVQRATTSLWGNGIVQLLAQEITEDLQAIRDEAAEAAGGEPGTSVERALTSKSISYGAIVATADALGQVSFDLSRVEGVDPDLVVRPLGWKGGGPTVRTSMVGASAGLMGMLAEELVWFRAPGRSTTRTPTATGSNVSSPLAISRPWRSIARPRKRRIRSGTLPNWGWSRRRTMQP